MDADHARDRDEAMTLRRVAAASVGDPSAESFHRSVGVNLAQLSGVPARPGAVLIPKPRRPPNRIQLKAIRPTACQNRRGRKPNSSGISQFQSCSAA